MTVRDDLREFIRSALLVDDLGDDDSFLETGAVDSLGIVQLMGFVEAELGVPVTEEDLVPANFDSVAKLDAFVQRKRAS
jgi:acyl carrier protein